MSDLYFYQLFAEIARAENNQHGCKNINAVFVGLLHDLQSKNLSKGNRYKDKGYYFNRSLESGGKDYSLPCLMVEPFTISGGVPKMEVICKNGVPTSVYTERKVNYRTKLSLLDIEKNNCCGRSGYCAERTKEQIISDCTILLTSFVDRFFALNEIARANDPTIKPIVQTSDFRIMPDITFSFTSANYGGVVGVLEFEVVECKTINSVETSELIAIRKNCC